ncbi:MAG: hypothetical protein AB7E85_05310 [Pseudobdellovibrionaceae bacterium]
MGHGEGPSLIGGNYYRHLCMTNFNDIVIRIKGVDEPAHLTLAHSLAPWQRPAASDKPRAKMELLQGGKPEYVSYRMHWEDPYEAAKARMLAMEFESRRGNVRVTVTEEKEDKDNIVPFPK